MIRVTKIFRAAKFAKLALLTLALLTSSLAAHAADGLLTREPAVVYDAPSDKAKALFIISGHQPLLLISKIHGWYKVFTYTGDSGWVSINDVQNSNNGVVLADRAAVFADPNTEADIIFYAKRGVVVEVLNNASGWLQIVHQDGESGYIPTNQVWLNH